MWYNDDSMLAELRQVKVRLWEKSGHDLHNMAKMIKRETDEIMLKYGKISQSKSSYIDVDTNKSA
jgi:hypothetical protein